MIPGRLEHGTRRGETFVTLKHVDACIRPIYHRTETRVRAHILHFCRLLNVRGQIGRGFGFAMRRQRSVQRRNCGMRYPC